MGLASFAWPMFINSVDTLAPPITSDHPFVHVAMAMQKNHPTVWHLRQVVAPRPRGTGGRGYRPKAVHFGGATKLYNIGFADAPKLRIAVVQDDC